MDLLVSEGAIVRTASDTFLVRLVLCVRSCTCLTWTLTVRNKERETAHGLDV
jgi:hypothetical protein